MHFVIAENELKMDLEKMAVIVNWSSPKSLFEVRSFHGLAMLETIKKPSQPFRWTDTVERSFQLLKKKIIERPILRFPYFKKLF